MHIPKSYCCRKWFGLALTSLVLVLIPGCDQIREKMAAAIKPKTIESVTVAVNEKIEQGKYKLAQTEGEEFLQGKDDSTGRLAWALAKASAQSGESDLAIKYLGQALKANVVTGPQAMAEPLLEPVHTDLRFVKMLVGVEASQSPQTAVSPPNTTQAKPSTSITMDSKGTEVKAGDITIKLLN